MHVLNLTCMEHIYGDCIRLFCNTKPVQNSIFHHEPETYVVSKNAIHLGKKKEKEDRVEKKRNE